MNEDECCTGGGSSGGDAASDGHPSDDAATLRLSVPGMDCAGCRETVESAIDGVEGVQSRDVRPTAGSATVRYDPDRAGEDELVTAVERSGYDVTEAESGEGAAVASAEPLWRSRRGVATIVGGVLLLAGLVVEFVATGANRPLVELFGVELLVADLLFLAAVAPAGTMIVRDGYGSLRNRSLDMDLLMTVAILGAIAAGLGFGERLYFEAATLAVLFSVAELLEQYSMDRARSSLRELMELSPDRATVRRGGEEVTVPVEDLEVGEVVLVHPGDRIPVDGRVIEGASAVDQSPITGESVPVDKGEGDEVYAGTVNEGGYLEVETADPGDTTISRIVDLVEEASADTTDREQFVERFASYYTPVVVGAAILTATLPPVAFGGSWPVWILRGLTLVVLACPCAFVISTPVSVVSGITSAARNGVLVKGGSYLEATGEVETVAFDKTGTLTTGELSVTDVIPLGDNTEGDVLRCAHGLESRSEHPIGEAIVDRAGDGPAREIEDFEALTGKGVRADLDGVPHYAGKPALFENLGFDLSHVHAAADAGEVPARTRELCERSGCVDLLDDLVPELQAEGKTVVLVGTDEELEGVIAVADRVRPGARAVVRRLKEMGVDRTVMLTGDNRRTARAIADQVGIDQVHAELLPERKVELIEEYRDDGGVAMVGDGVNDAPALATATVGVAMGAAGTDAALETADVALMGDDLSKLPYLYDLSGATRSVIRANVWTSLGAKALLAAGVPLGLVPIWAAVLVGDVGMTTAVTGNAMRLSRIEPDEPATDDPDAAPVEESTPDAPEREPEPATA